MLSWLSFHQFISSLLPMIELRKRQCTNLFGYSTKYMLVDTTLICIRIELFEMTEQKHIVPAPWKYVSKELCVFSHT